MSTDAPAQTDNAPIPERPAWHRALKIHAIRFFIDNRASRRVDQKTSSTHQRKCLRSDHFVSFGGERCVNRDDVARRHELLEWNPRRPELER